MINASLGNPDRRPPLAHDAGLARAEGHQARSLTLAKHPMPGNHGVAATPDHLSSLSARASQANLCYSRRRFEALDLLSLLGIDLLMRQARRAKLVSAETSG